MRSEVAALIYHAKQAPYLQVRTAQAAAISMGAAEREHGRTVLPPTSGRLLKARCSGLHSTPVELEAGGGPHCPAQSRQCCSAPGPAVLHAAGRKPGSELAGCMLGAAWRPIPLRGNQGLGFLYPLTGIAAVLTLSTPLQRPLTWLYGPRGRHCSAAAPGTAPPLLHTPGSGTPLSAAQPVSTSAQHA